MDDSLPSSHLLGFEWALDNYLPLKVPKRTPKEKKDFLGKIKTLEKSKIYKRFIEDGILELITLEDFISNWRYIGGTKNLSDLDDETLIKKNIQHEEYLFRVYGINYLNIDYNKLKTHCVCNTSIKQRIFISDGNRVITIGNECVVSFFEEECKKNIKQKCTICGEYHKNRLGTLCNDCRIGRCMKCGIDINEMYNKCFKCNFGEEPKTESRKDPDDSEFTSDGEEDPYASLKKSRSLNFGDYLLSKFFK